MTDIYMKGIPADKTASGAAGPKVDGSSELADHGMSLVFGSHFDLPQCDSFLSSTKRFLSMPAFVAVSACCANGCTAYFTFAGLGSSGELVVVVGIRT
jgi:hypothetical protein